MRGPTAIAVAVAAAATAIVTAAVDVMGAGVVTIYRLLVPEAA